RLATISHEVRHRWGRLSERQLAKSSREIIETIRNVEIRAQYHEELALRAQGLKRVFDIQWGFSIAALTQTELATPLSLEQKRQIYFDISNHVAKNYRDSDLTNAIDTEIFSAKKKTTPEKDPAPTSTFMSMADILSIGSLYSETPVEAALKPEPPLLYATQPGTTKLPPDFDSLDPKIQTLIKRGYYLSALQFTEGGYIYRAIRSGLREAIKTNAVVNGNFSTTEYDLEADTGVFFVSHEISDATAILASNLDNSDWAIAVFPSQLFNNAVATKTAAVLRFAEGGISFNYPFFCSAPKLSDAAFIIIPSSASSIKASELTGITVIRYSQKKNTTRTIAIENIITERGLTKATLVPLPTATSNSTINDDLPDNQTTISEEARLAKSREKDKRRKEKNDAESMRRMRYFLSNPLEFSDLQQLARLYGLFFKGKPIPERKAVIEQLTQKTKELLERSHILQMRLSRLNQNPQTFSAIDTLTLERDICSYELDYPNIDSPRSLLSPESREHLKAAKHKSKIKDEKIPLWLACRIFGYQEGESKFYKELKQRGVVITSEKSGYGGTASPYVNFSDLLAFCKTLGTNNPSYQILLDCKRKTTAYFLEYLRLHPIIPMNLADKILSGTKSYTSRQTKRDRLQGTGLGSLDTHKRYVSLDDIIAILEDEGKKHEALVLREMAFEFYKDSRAALSKYAITLFDTKTTPKTESAEALIQSQEFHIAEALSLVGFKTKGYNDWSITILRNLFVTAESTVRLMVYGEGETHKQTKPLITFNSLIECFRGNHCHTRAEELRGLKQDIIAGKIKFHDFAPAFISIAKSNPCLSTAEARIILGCSHSNMTYQARLFKDSKGSKQPKGIPHLEWSTGKSKVTNRYFLLDLLETLEKRGMNDLARKIYQERLKFVDENGLIDVGKLVEIVNQCRASLGMERLNINTAE
ncbi:MAG: hypothetical protein KBC84_06135, partial [Proteobacteria bacterium]|nr:hypothetical protein [Pseudomonadota bacterium]